MKTMINSRILLLGFIGVVVLGGCFLLGHFAITQTALADSQIAISSEESMEPDKIEFNEDGLSYGTINSRTKDGQLPELLLVVASNGLEGYIYTAESNLEDPPPASSEEAIEITNMREERASQLFAPSLFKELGLNVKEDAVATLEVYRAAMDYITPAEPGEELVDNIKARNALAEATGLSVNELPNAQDLQMAIYNALANSQEYNEIPVYEKDGKTQIGVFLEVK